MKQEIKPATYEQIRAQAQAAANVDGFDRGLENNPYAGWLYFMLPAKGHRTGRELRCEVVSCEDLYKCRPGHGPAASDTKEALVASLRELLRSFTQENFTASGKFTGSWEYMAFGAAMYGNMLLGALQGLGCDPKEELQRARVTSE